MAEQEERIKQDIKLVIETCEADSTCPFRNFKKRGSELHWDRFPSKGVHIHYCWIFAKDYPDNTILLTEDLKKNSTHSKFDVRRDRLPVAVHQLLEDITGVKRVPFENNNVVKPEKLLEGQATGGSAARPGSQPDQLKTPYERLLGGDSSHTDCTSDDNEDFDMYDNDEDEMCESECMALNPLLLDDMERARNVYGDDALDHRLLAGIDCMDVELMVPLDFMEREVAAAWKLKVEECLIIRLSFSASSYLEGAEPKVEVFQPSQKERFGIGSQTKKILEAFFRTIWKSLNERDVRAGIVERPASHLPPKKKPQKEALKTRLRCKAPPEKDIKHIVEMGFTRQMASNALTLSHGSLDDALNLLLTEPERCQDDAADDQADSKKSGKATSGRSTQPSLVNTIAGMIGLSGPEGRRFEPSVSVKKAREVPKLDQGFLVQVMRYIRQRLPTLNEFCVVCDEPHVFQSGGMLKPAVCARELCVFSFQTLGVMSDAAEDIATGAEVVDLLIAMATTACKSDRRELIFDPFPTVVDPKKGTELALSPKNKDFARASRALDGVMQMEAMMTVASSDLRREMDKRDILAYPLLQWIITSNRSHIVKLPEDKQLAFMQTPHQYLLMSSPPAKEAAFRAAKKEFGSTFAFHGSGIANWHSILRQGLINASGTKYQMNGAVHGKGIYLSPLTSVSFSYSGMHGLSVRRMPAQRAQRAPAPTPAPGAAPPKAARRPRFLKSSNLTCIALCEVVTCPALKKSSNNIWVMPDADHVCTRFFFVYEDGQAGDSNVDLQKQTYLDQVMKATRVRVI